MPRQKKFEIRKCQWAAGSRYLVDLGKIKQDDGSSRRIRRFFQVKKDAELYLAEHKVKLVRHGHASVALSEDERIIFQAARDRLARVGATVTEAADFYIANHKEIKAPITLRDLIGKCVLDKELTGAKKRYLQTFACSCRSFACGREERLAHTVTRDEVKGWILGSGFSPKTQRNYLGDLREALAWAVKERYIRTNPIAGPDGFVRLEPTTSDEILALDLDQCVKLLRTALNGTHLERERAGTGKWRVVPVEGGFRCLLGYLVIGMFSGVRPDEILRTDLARLNLRERTLVITVKSSKTRQRRVIELERVAVVWLRLWRRICPQMKNIAPANLVKRWRALRGMAGISKWPHDALRHTFASYHFAAFQNIAQLQAQMGHTEDEDTLFRHYRAVTTVSGHTVSKKAGEQFWKLTPRSVRLWRG